MSRFHLSNIIFTLAIIVFGLVLLLVSTNEYSYSGFNISSALSMIGSFLVVGAIVSFYFENFAKFQMFEDIFERVIGSSSAFSAGVAEHFQNSKEINYAKQIKESKNIVTFFTYSDGFLKRYKEDLQEFINRGNKITLYYVAKDSKYISLICKMGWSIDSINANYSYIDDFAKQHAENPKVRVVYCDAIPRYSAIIFDHEVYIIEQTTSVGSRTVPAMKIDGAGYLAKFYREDIERLESAT